MSFLLSRSPLLTITTGKDSGFSDMIFFKYLTFQCNLNCQILILHENYNQFVNIQSYSITQDGFTNMRWFNEMCCVVYKSYHIIFPYRNSLFFPFFFLNVIIKIIYQIFQKQQDDWTIQKHSFDSIMKKIIW